MLLDYVLATDDEIFESTEGSGPFEVVIGSGKLHPMIESCLMGLPEGAEFEKIIDAGLTFGKPDEALKMTIVRAKLPEAARALTKGMSFEAPGPKGQKKVFRVVESFDDKIVVDGNHPMAGLDLILSGKILRVDLTN